MADFERRERFENAVIDMKDLTITEFTDNETRCYDLMSLLKRWDGVVGITLTIERKVPLPPDGRDDVCIRSITSWRMKIHMSMD